MKARLQSLLRSRVLFALVMQGINGLIQVQAFFSLRGPNYLAFSSAYLLGTLLSLGLVLNFENVVLAGRWTTSVRRYGLALWWVGLAAALAAVIGHAQVPSFVSFCAFGVCFRLFMAWANQARPAPLSLTLAGGLVLLTCLLGNLSQVMLAAMLAFPLAAWRAQGPQAGGDGGLATVLHDSLRAFIRYLPHTLSGMVIGYLDRYVALNIVGGTAAETYLRTVQVGSWAAFLAYPVVFQVRGQVLQAGRLQAATAWRAASLVAASMALAVAALLAMAVATGRMPALSVGVVATVFAALVCSQCYQIASSLNFVGERFGIINRITLASASTVLLLAAALLPFWRTAEVLSLLLFSGWFTQLWLTLLNLRRQSH